eukprot:213022-Chlamydomonas_euryale.AAC.13
MPARTRVSPSTFLPFTLLAPKEHLTYGDGKYDFLDALEAAAVGVLVTRKPLTAAPDEVAVNARSRSAKLRVLQRK